MFVLQPLHAHVSNFFVWCSCYASEPKAQHFWILDRGESVWVVPLSWVTFALVIPGDTGVVAVLLPQAGAAVSIGTLISSHLILDHGPWHLLAWKAILTLALATCLLEGCDKSDKASTVWAFTNIHCDGQPDLVLNIKGDKNARKS